MTLYFRGKPACSCLIAWLPVYEAELKRLGAITHSIDILQLIGGASASAGTHRTGGAFDIAQTSDTAIKIARQMGADATWHRTPAQGFGHHAHGVLRGCEHNSAARYQIAAVDAGYNGLGYAGRGGRDDGPRPLSKRTWKQGIAWAKARQKTQLRFATYNLPGEDKLPSPHARTVAAVALLRSAPPAFIGWNELVGIKAPGVSSDFAHHVDEVLGAYWNLVKPTKAWNENYISYDTRILELVHQYDDSILEAATGNRHLTRVVFKVKATGFVFAVGQTHLVNGSTTAHEADRQKQSADALASMKAVSAKHGNCPFIIQGDVNTAKPLKALVDAGMKNARQYADNSTSRDHATYTNYAKTVPSTNLAQTIDASYVSREFYCVGYAVRRKLDTAGNYTQPRPSDHDPVVSSIRT